jgi:predicted ATPase with chaperone activity
LCKALSLAKGVSRRVTLPAHACRRTRRHPLIVRGEHIGYEKPLALRRHPVPASPRLVTPEKRDEDAERSLRPLALADFTGQEATRKNLKVFIEAARARREALDHVLFVGPPGLGKTTLAQIVKFIVSIRRSRKSSIRRWRIISSIS